MTPACRGTDQALFFPDTGGGTLGDVLRAKAICRRCPLLRPCRDWALKQPARHLYGVWGGTSRGERMARTPPGERSAMT
nr:WhiB family transcriptional regulator [Micromonospora tulbaghiae]